MTESLAALRAYFAPLKPFWIEHFTKDDLGCEVQKAMWSYNHSGDFAFDFMGEEETYIVEDVKVVPRAFYCDYCGMRSQKACGRCGKRNYCDYDCLRAAWPKHRLECHLLTTDPRVACVAQITIRSKTDPQDKRSIGQDANMSRHWLYGWVRIKDIRHIILDESLLQGKSLLHHFSAISASFRHSNQPLQQQQSVLSSSRLQEFCSQEDSIVWTKSRLFSPMSFVQNPVLGTHLLKENPSVEIKII